MNWLKEHWAEIAGGATGAVVGGAFGLGIPGAIIGQSIGNELTHGSEWRDVKDAALVAAAILVVFAALRIVTRR